MITNILPIHNRTGVHAVGFRRDGRPIWPIRGGSGEGPPTAPPAPGDPNPDNSTPPASESSPPAPAVDEQRLTEAEQHASEQSERAQQLQAALDAVQQALNPDGGAGEQDPAQLAAVVADRDKQLDQVAAELRTAKVELAAHKAATTEGARADRLLNSRSFLDAVSGLDPDSPKFEQQLAEQIRAAVEADPELYGAAGPGPAKGGAEFNGPPTADQRPKSLQDAVAARLGS